MLQKRDIFHPRQVTPFNAMFTLAIVMTMVFFISKTENGLLVNFLGVPTFKFDKLPRIPGFEPNK
jgi:hypothetical protein